MRLINFAAVQQRYNKILITLLLRHGQKMFLFWLLPSNLNPQQQQNIWWGSKRSLILAAFLIFSVKNFTALGTKVAPFPWSVWGALFNDCVNFPIAPMRALALSKQMALPIHVPWLWNQETYNQNNVKYIWLKSRTVLQVLRGNSYLSVVQENTKVWGHTEYL
jgi:hypothetical protein